MKYFSIIILLFISGCGLYFDMIHSKKFPPLCWQDGNKYYGQIEMSQGWGVFLEPSAEDYSSLLKLNDLNVKCSIINNSEDTIYIAWRAYSEEEKQYGEIVHKYNSDNSEKRSKTLKPGEKVYWHVGKMKSLFYYQSLAIGFASNSKTENIKYSLELEFEKNVKLDELTDIKEFKIPVVGRSTF